MFHYSDKYDLFPMGIEGEFGPRIVGIEGLIDLETPSYSMLQEPSRPNPFFAGIFFSNSYDGFEK